jgi:Polysaccharide lyase family 4, domain II
VSWGYEESLVKDGGMLGGNVTLKGEKPIPRAFNLVTFPDPVYCGRISNGSGWRLLREFTVGENHAVKDVVVMLTGIDRGKPFPFQDPRIEASDCQFKPFVTVVRNEEKVSVLNMDPVMHDIQAYETSELGPRVLFNVPLPMNPHHPRTAGLDAEYHKHMAGEPMTQTIHMTKGRQVFVMQCGFHAYMESWGLAVDNPYYTLTDAKGNFEIKDIPPGTYKMTVWHPQARSIIEQEIMIQTKSETIANFELQPREGPRAGMDAVENPRFSLRILGERQIKPTLELQQP